MKQFKITILMLFTLTILATSQSSVTIVALGNPRSSSNVFTVKPHYVTDEMDIDVFTYFVGTSGVKSGELRRHEDGTYHVISPYDAVSVRFKVNISGFTCWGDCETRLWEYDDVYGPVTYDKYSVYVPGEVNVTEMLDIPLLVYENGSTYEHPANETVWYDVSANRTISIPKHNVTLEAVTYTIPAYTNDTSYTDSPFVTANGNGTYSLQIPQNVTVWGEDEVIARKAYNITLPEMFIASANATSANYTINTSTNKSEWVPPVTYVNASATSYITVPWQNSNINDTVIFPAANASYEIIVVAYTQEVAGFDIGIPNINGTEYNIKIPEYTLTELTKDAYNETLEYWEDTRAGESQAGKDPGYTTFGQLFAIIDGTVSLLGSAWASASGVDILLTKGDHVVTFLYVNKGETDGFMWASDTAIIRVAKSEADLGRLGFQSSPVEFTYTDAATTTDTLSGTAAIWERGSWNRQIISEPSVDLTFKYGSTTLSDGGAINVADPTTKLTISGNINSSGFEDSITKGSWADVTKGYVFLFDAFGVHLVDSSSTTAMVTYFTSDAVASTDSLAMTSIGLVVLSEYGMFKGNYELDPDGDACGASCVSDFEFFESTAGGIIFDGSFDFLAASDIITIFDDPNFGVTETSTIRTTSTLEPETTVITQTEPGFGALVSLLALGIIAFVAPRFRREK